MFKKRKKAQTPPPPARPPAIGDPFAVIPVLPENVQMKCDSRGMVHLRLMSKPTGMTGKVVDWLHYDYSRKLELDEPGSLYLNCVDGCTTLDAITNRIAEKLAISRQDAERAVMLFTKKLMTWNFIALIVPEELVGSLRGS